MDGGAGSRRAGAPGRAPANAAKRSRPRAAARSVTAAGDVLASRYRLVDKIATGGMGLVWQAWDELLLRTVAVKQLLPQPGLSEADVTLARNRVIREARLTARLHHPHAVTLYDVVDHDGHPCLIMQFVRSDSLSALLHAEGTLAVPVVSRIGADVASALVAAHAVGIVHRDVKPGNVLIADDGSAKLTDFGISHAVGDITLTATGMVSGTPAFLAPEVARGAESGYPADVFSLGSTLYAALEGNPPFGSDPNPMAMLHRVGLGRIDPPRRSGPLTPLLLRMLVPEPAARPVMEEVAQALTGRPVEVRTVRDEPPTAVISAQTGREPRPELVPATPSGPVQSGMAEPGRQPAHAAPVDPAARRRATGPVLAILAAVLVTLTVIGVVLVRSNNTPADSVAATSQPDQTGAPVADSSISSAALSVSVTAPATSVAMPAVPASSPVTPPPATTVAAGAPPAVIVSTTTPQPTALEPGATLADPTTEESVEQQDVMAVATPTADDLVTAVGDYYALMPGNTDAGWARLTPDFQNGIARDRDYYERFWGRVESVVATDISGYPPDTAEATITYDFKDGSVSVERTSYQLVPDGGILKFANSEVLSGGG